ncbi:MFS transporter [Hypericibacter sp.]|uniref:MFS transporter n=1 Tax=Hypericibacter sp. TaxID=2705401 RepID=UPI003D6D0AF6
MLSAATRRNVFILALCQALNVTGLSLMITVSAVTGHKLSSDPALSTLPLGLQFTAAMLTTFPVSLLMKRVGRRIGFSLGAFAALLGGTIMLVGVLQASFVIFCIGNAFIGIGAATAQFYRFAAADAADESFKARAISMVMVGGLIAAFLGPLSARWSRLAIEGTEFAGSFVVVMGLGLAALLLLQLLRIPRLTLEERRDTGRPLGEIARNATFVVAVIGGMIGYATMSFVMTASPLAMMAHNHSFDDNAFVIQWHVVGMFAPSFFTGHLIQRFGVLNVMLAGAAALLACVATGLSGTEVAHFWGAMLLLGLGWNFLYIGASALLTETYRPAERAKVQALNDFLIGFGVSVASLSSGALQAVFGWEVVNLSPLPAILAAALAVLWLKSRRRAMAAVGSSLV